MKQNLLIFLLLFSWNSLAYVDFSINYSQSIQKVEGIETTSNPEPGAAITTTEGYTVNWAWYMWEYTALELNYSQTTERLLDDRQVSVVDGGTTFIIKEIDSTVLTEVAGAGIRQAFASRKAAIIPSLAIGYAKYTTSGTTKYTLDASGTELTTEDTQDKRIFSSSYAAFSLRFRITQLMGLTIAAKSIMPDFKTSEAQNNVTYSAGFSWIF